ncbi:MAG: hypothetical protein O7B32_03870 [Thaumarchaeota archaeon]|nr:hypothetical protein [Nitrososphaerota archaeon]
MARHSRRKRKEKKAVSTILGGAIIFGILFSVGASYYTTLTSRVDLYQSAANERNDRDFGLAIESLTLQPTINFTLSSILVTIVNDGPVAVEMIEMFYVWNGTTTEITGSSIDPDFPYTMNSGKEKTFDTNIVANTTTNFILKILTSRGGIFVGEFPPPEFLAELAIPKLSFAEGTMSVRYCCYAAMRDNQDDDPKKDGDNYVAVGDMNWTKPIIQWEIVQAAYWYQHKPKDHPFNTTIWIKGLFFNLEEYDMFINTGSILIQVGFGGDNKKVFYMGGLLTEPILINSNSLGEATFKITEFVDDLKKSEKNLKGTWIDLPWEFAGLASFAGSKSTGNATYDAIFKTKDPGFRTGALLMEGILVYGISMLSPSEATFSKVDDGVGWNVNTTLTATSYIINASVPFDVTLSGLPGEISAIISRTPLTPSSDGVGLADQSLITFTVDDAGLKAGDKKIKIILTSTSTVPKVDGSFQIVTITNTFTLHIVARISSRRSKRNPIKNLNDPDEKFWIDELDGRAFTSRRLKEIVGPPASLNLDSMTTVTGHRRREVSEWNSP